MSTKLKIMLKESTFPMLYIAVVVVGAGLLAQEKTEVLSDWHFYLAFAILIIGGSLLCPCSLICPREAILPSHRWGPLCGVSSTD